ncbi:MAG: efflux RND transporter periplasmic adaptor subunit [Myxococcales bacterium]
MNDTHAATDDLKRFLAIEEGGRRWLRRLGVASVVALVLGGGVLWRARHQPAPPARFVTADLSVGDVVEKVQATGTVQPLLQVNVGAQVNGRVTKVFVDFNSVVKKGDPLAEIDPTLYGTQVSAQQANVVAQQAQYESAKAQVRAMDAQLEAAKVAFERVERLHGHNLATRAEVDAARGQYDSLRAQLDASKANMGAARAAIGASQAQLNQSNTNLGYTKIFSPVDGIVITRGIDPGATVVASFQAPVLFVIAQDLRKMRVLADVDEADVGKLHERMQAEAVVDAFPGESFQGIVQQIRYSPNNVQGVVTYSAIVEVENPEEKLRPGMTATITIKTREAKAVVRVPNAALRYKPSPPIGADGKVVPAAPDPPLAKGQGRVFLLLTDRTESRLVPIGVTDGMFTEVGDGALAASMKVVIDENESEEDKKKRRKVF